MITALSEKLQVYNDWGLVSVEKQAITVILSAVTPEGRPITRTVKREIERPLGFNGAALVALNITGHEYTIGVHEIGADQVIGHPEVEKILKDVVDWIRNSAKL